VGLEGTLTARRSSVETAAWRRAASQFVTNALGRSMWVDGGAVDPTISVVRAATAPDTPLRP
jgi:hypothetical protein